MNVAAVPEPTASLLLATLRRATGCGQLDYHAPPTALTGGYHAELLRFRLTNPPAGLAGELVARIVPSPDVGAWEATVQRQVADQGFPTPFVRLTATATSPLGRYLIVMDHVDARTPMAGLGLGSIARQLPALVRHLPDELAHIAARLHALDPGPLAAALDRLGSTMPTTTAGFVSERAEAAELAGRPDIARAARRLLGCEPPARSLVVSHGDLHPFNLLVTDSHTWLIDWTVTRIADPAFTIAFTELMLSNPPLPLPAAGRRMLTPLTRSMAARFVRSYRALTDGTPAAIDDETLDWHRKVHALRILVETAGWEAEPSPSHGHHPWTLLVPVARRLLDLEP